MTILPQPIPVTVGWQLADWTVQAVTSEPAAGGLATAYARQLGAGEMWLIDHAVVSCNSGTPTQLRYYLDFPSPANLIDGTASGNFDVGDWPAGLLIQAGHALVMQWSNAADGAIGTSTLQLRYFTR